MLYVKCLRNCRRSKFLKLHNLAHNLCSYVVLHSIRTCSFAGRQRPLWKDLILYTDTQTKAQGCPGRFWVLYGTLKVTLLHIIKWQLGDMDCSEKWIESRFERRTQYGREGSNKSVEDGEMTFAVS